MNRETKRLLQRQGQIGPDGSPVAAPARPAQGGAKARSSSGGKRGNPISWFRDVRAELRRVAWPTRNEVRRYSAVVLFTLLLLIALIFGLDFVFSKAAIFLFK